MLAVSCDAELGDAASRRSRTTKVSTPPSRASPPTRTRAVATPRGTRRACNQCTAGVRSAASSSAMATGTTTAATYDTTSADDVERSDHDEQPPPQRGADPQYAGYHVRASSAGSARCRPLRVHEGLRWPQRRARRSGDHSRCSLAGRHRASVSPSRAASPTDSVPPCGRLPAGVRHCHLSDLRFAPAATLIPDVRWCLARGRSLSRVAGRSSSRGAASPAAGRRPGARRPPGPSPLGPPRGPSRRSAARRWSAAPAPSHGRSAPSNPTTLTSSGTRSPSPAAACSTPAASTSLWATIAVGRRRRGRRAAPGRPPRPRRRRCSRSRHRDRTEDVLDALDPVPHVAVVRPGAAGRVDGAARAVEAQRHRDDRDAAVAQVAQVGGELRGAGAVVDVDQHDVVGDRALDADDGDAAGPQQVERRVVLEPAGGEDRGVERDAGELVDRGPAGVAREQEQPDAVAAEHLGDAVEQLDGDRVAERVEQAFPDEGADDAAPTAAQRRGDRVRAGVAQLGGRARGRGRGWPVRRAGCRRRRARPSTARRPPARRRRPASGAVPDGPGGAPGGDGDGARLDGIGLSGARSRRTVDDRIDSMARGVRVTDLQVSPRIRRARTAVAVAFVVNGLVLRVVHLPDAGRARHARACRRRSSACCCCACRSVRSRGCRSPARSCTASAPRRAVFAGSLTVGLGLAGIGDRPAGGLGAARGPEPGARRAGHRASGTSR